MGGEVARNRLPGVRVVIALRARGCPTRRPEIQHRCPTHGNHKVNAEVMWWRTYAKKKNFGSQDRVHARKAELKRFLGCFHSSQPPSNADV